MVSRTPARKWRCKTATRGVRREIGIRSGYPLSYRAAIVKAIRMIRLASCTWKEEAVFAVFRTLQISQMRLSRFPCLCFGMAPSKNFIASIFECITSESGRSCVSPALKDQWAA